MNDKTKKNIACAMLLSLLGYWTIAAAAFRLRHPWATDTEIVLSVTKVVTFQYVPYEQMRPRE